MIRQDGDEWICPDCGQSFGNYGICQHWTKSSYCDWPIPEADVRDTMVGLYFAGGTTNIHSNNGINMVLEKTSTNKEAMDWLQSELGFWLTGVEAQDPSPEYFKELTGEKFDLNTQYRIRLRANPWVKTVDEADPVDVPMAARSAAILFAFKGNVSDRSGITLRSKRPQKLVRWLLGNGFADSEITETTSDRAYHVIYLTSAASRRFFKLIEDEVVPGFDGRWKFEFRKRGSQGSKPKNLINEQSI